MPDTAVPRQTPSGPLAETPSYDELVQENARLRLEIIELRAGGSHTDCEPRVGTA